MRETRQTIALGGALGDRDEVRVGEWRGIGQAVEPAAELLEHASVAEGHSAAMDARTEGLRPFASSRPSRERPRQPGVADRQRDWPKWAWSMSPPFTHQEVVCTGGEVSSSGRSRCPAFSPPVVGPKGMRRTSSNPGVRIRKRMCDISPVPSDDIGLSCS